MSLPPEAVADADFAIVIPAIKTAFLAAAVASALSQQHPAAREVLVLDDASPEDIPGVLQQFDDPRLRYQRLAENLGAVSPARTWNAALAEVSANWVLVLGDDDVYGPGALTALAAIAAAQPNVAVLRLRLRVIDGNDQVIDVVPPQADHEQWWQSAQARFGLRRPLSLSEHAFHRQRLLAAGGFRELAAGCGSDDWAVLDLARRHCGIACTNQGWAGWRRHGANLSDQRPQPQRLHALLEVMDWLQAGLRQWQPAPPADEAQALAQALAAYRQGLVNDLAGLAYLASWRGRLRQRLIALARALRLAAP